MGHTTHVNKLGISVKQNGATDKQQHDQSELYGKN